MIPERLIRAISLAGLCALVACSPNATAPSPPSGSAAAPSDAGIPIAPDSGSLVLVGRIITMDDPPMAEAVFIEDGMVVSVGTRDEVLAAAGDRIPVVDIGDNVAYPGSSTPMPTGSGTAATTTSTPRRPRSTRPSAADGPRSPSSG